MQTFERHCCKNCVVQWFIFSKSTILITMFHLEHTPESYKLFRIKNVPLKHALTDALLDHDS